MIGFGIGIGIGLGASRPRRGDGDEEVPRKYLFIDGAFLRSFIDEITAKTRLESDITISVKFDKIARGFDRVLFYDAYPEKNPDQSESEFENEMQLTEDFFRSLSEIPNFNVRPALTRRGKRRQQKGVDVLLAIECLMHSIRGNIDEATIMTSDLDFFPLFEALLQTKTRSRLRYQIGRTSQELIGAADQSTPITAYDFFNWLEDPARTLLSVSNWTEDDKKYLEPVRNGRIRDKHVELCKHKQKDAYTIKYDDQYSGCVSQIPMICIGHIEGIHKAPIVWE